MWRITMWSVIVAVLLTSAGWLYYGLKREARREEHYKQEQALLRAQHKEDLEAISALSAGLGRVRVLGQGQRQAEQRTTEGEEGCGV
jgi:type VI protein secretion system component VasK